MSVAIPRVLPMAQTTVDESAPPKAFAAGPAEAAPPALRRAALSPSRVNDFKQCPLLYRFRALDRLPEPPSSAATRGTLVHAVLERLFDLPATERVAAAARDLLGPQWEELREREPDVAELFSGEAELRQWMSGAAALLDTYFTLEDPRRLEPAEREVLCEVELESGLLLRGIVDRVDVAPNGAVRVVDYKTGRSPSDQFVSSALFQMRFYALVLWRLRGVIPRRLQLIYLGNGEVLTYDPDEASLLATERTVEAVWVAIRRSLAARSFPPRTSRLCDWCAHQAVCPAFGGTPPAWPEKAAERLLAGATPEE